MSQHWYPYEVPRRRRNYWALGGRVFCPAAMLMEVGFVAMEASVGNVAMAVFHATAGVAVQAAWSAIFWFKFTVR